jgi:hypothetical protein
LSAAGEDARWQREAGFYVLEGMEEMRAWGKIPNRALGHGAGARTGVAGVAGLVVRGAVYAGTMQRAKRRVWKSVWWRPVASGASGGYSGVVQGGLVAGGNLGGGASAVFLGGVVSYANS